MREERLDNVEIVVPVEMGVPYTSIRRSKGEIERDAKELLDEIQGHRWGRRAEIRREVSSFCSFCGRVWTESKDSPHNGGCCDRDVENMAPDPYEEIGLTEAEPYDPGEG